MVEAIHLSKTAEFSLPIIKIQTLNFRETFMFKFCNNGFCGKSNYKKSKHKPSPVSIYPWEFMKSEENSTCWEQECAKKKINKKILNLCYDAPLQLGATLYREVGRSIFWRETASSSFWSYHDIILLNFLDAVSR